MTDQPKTALGDGGPAFARPYFEAENGEFSLPQTGMSLRDWFAGQAMSRLLDTCRGDNLGIDFVDHVACHSYRAADAMLRARMLAYEADGGRDG